MTAKEWRQINSALRNERCILFLGPGVSQALAKNTWQPLHQLFTQYLVEELEAEGMSYDQQLVHSMPYMVSCFMKIEGVMDTDPADEARAFYKRHSKKIPPTLQQLAQLPFSLIINTSPDDLMVKALKEVGKFQVNHNYYNFRRANKNETIPAFSSDEPLVFNLCGYFDDADSLIITEKDKSRFLKNIARNEPRVPTEITSRFDSRTFYLLLGFDLEDWKYKLLFDTLHLDDNLSAIVPTSDVFNITDYNKDYFSSSFNCNFIDLKPSEFASQLSSKFGNKKQDTAVKAPENPVEVFIAFEEEEEKFNTQLNQYLAVLEQKCFINIWHPGKVEVGEDMETAVADNLEKADIILLLVSADFLAGDFLYEPVMRRILRKARRGGKTVVPIIARSCDWEDASIAELPLILPKGGKPIKSKHWANVEAAYTNVVTELKQVIFSKIESTS